MRALLLVDQGDCHLLNDKPGSAVRRGACVREEREVTVLRRATQHWGYTCQFAALEITDGAGRPPMPECRRHSVGAVSACSPGSPQSCAAYLDAAFALLQQNS